MGSVMRELAELHIERISGIPVARLRGELDLSNSGRIGAEIRSGVANTDRGLVVDLSGVTYLDSSGVRLLFDLDAQLRTRVQQLRVVLPAQAYIRTIFSICRLDESVPMYPTVEEAVAGFQEGEPD